jgi:8-oxo-dGTP pyrophosphatase MutT (NUDIX family)
MVFAAGTTVFPGGRVDAADSELPWSGRSPDGLALRLGCDALVARALVGAAVRETFEEAACC